MGLHLTCLTPTDSAKVVQDVIRPVTSSHGVPAAMQCLSECWGLSKSRSGPRSADHVLRELLGAPHLAAHEGRKTAADDRAHRDEGNAALHEPRRLTYQYMSTQCLRSICSQHENMTFPRKRDAQSFICSISTRLPGWLYMRIPLRTRPPTLARSRTSCPRYPGTRGRARTQDRGARRECRTQRRRARGR